MTFYESIMPLQSYFDSGLDEPGRQTLTFNVLVTKAPSDTFEEELIAVLIAGGAATAFGTDVFCSSSAQLPNIPDDPATDTGFLEVIAGGGMGPMNTQNEKTVTARDRPAAQIIAHAVSYAAAKTKIIAAYKAMRAVINTNVTPVPTP